MAINWIERDEFQKRFETQYLPQKRYLIYSLESKTSFAEICEILPVSLSIDVDEDDGLGKRRRWFGVATDDLLFTIDCYECLSSPISLHSLYKDELSEKYQWSFLEKLIDLPAPILNRIIWVRSEFFFGYKKSSLKTQKTIFYKDKHGINWEVYQAVSDAEAIELLSFLQKLNSEYEYWIGQPEDENLNWIAIRQAVNEEDKIVARYTNRGSTEDFARRKSLKDNAFYRVKQEKSDKFGLAFHNGKIFK